MRAALPLCPDDAFFKLAEARRDQINASPAWSFAGGSIITNWRMVRRRMKLRGKVVILSVVISFVGGVAAVFFDILFNRIASTSAVDIVVVAAAAAAAAACAAEILVMLEQR